MPEVSWRELLAGAISLSIGIGFMMAGLYSLLVNRPVALARHYPRDARFAKLAGWGYMIIGVAMIIVKSL